MVFIAHVNYDVEGNGGKLCTDRIVVMADDFTKAVEQIEGYYDSDLMGLNIDFIHEMSFLYLTESAEVQIRELEENHY